MIYHMEENIGGLQLRRIYYKNTNGEISFGKFEQ